MSGIAPAATTSGVRIRLGRPGKVWLLVACITAAATFVFRFVGGFEAPGPISLPWWALAGVFYLAEAYLVHALHRREAHTLSLSELGLVFGLFFTGPGGLLAAQLVGAGLALRFHRRTRPLRLGLTLAQLALGTCLATLVFHASSDLGGGSAPGLWAGAFAAALVAKLTSLVLGTFAVSLAGEGVAFDELRPVGTMVLAGTVATTSLALAAVELMKDQGPDIVLVIAPFVGSILVFQAYTSQRRRHEHLGFLYETMQRIQRVDDIETGVRELLTSLREMFRAAHVEMVLVPPSEQDAALRCVVGPDGETVMESAELSPLERVALDSASSVQGAVAVTRRGAMPAIDRHLAERGLDHGMLTALRGEERVFGLLLVGDRSGDLSAFTDDERRLLETFAGHAALMLENDRLEQSLEAVTRLKEQLRHQAFHDALTGLPNRRLFTEKVAEAVADAVAGGPLPAVLFLDLDDFKTINDSLGHAAGDELLAGVAQRVRTSVRPGDVPARLGGDEFAVLIRVARPGDADLVASRLAYAVRVPFLIGGREVSAHASIGIAIGADTVSAQELLRNADVAMYSAKDRGKRRYATFEPEMHLHVRRRHELAAALERAVERAEFRVHYQPIVELATARTVALESLLRWQHPARGLLQPAEFVPLAEETGLIESITVAVLREACASGQRWRTTLRNGTELLVAVNISPVELQGEGLAGRVAGVLDETGLPPHALILEITESGAFRDADGALSTMHALRALGVRLALDDFGTGHSSLSHLRELPVDALKIAKPFVDRLRSDPPDTVFADMIVRLAGALELDVVAEGIETAGQGDLLRGLGCRLGQGFHFARPADRTGAETRLQAAELRRAAV